MNARQKAKFYKRKYEELLKSPVKFKVEQYKIDTLRFERLYPEYLITQENDSYFREVMLNDMAQGLANNLDKYIDYYIKFCPDINKYCICWEIKVLNRLYEHKGEVL